ncbi:RNA polymerase recycling motor ATPase HelR [Nocardioides jiangxiensis]|uniref:RNA polymerase recycling motor ATPase HelR n=1 Tax=Nocardioides jiangxiensis TaxID=3064524 RepID=A0ABT9AXG5_9ACTN|nr:RNA polymerase recycling motor ATPase HelR [Nocardioides sp. WY-20]MDO7867055.1 RNA polymerase recycling motor ATPase HelR [Nocardioides sp. WY-20]
MTTSVFDLPDALAGKARPDLIAADATHFAHIERVLADQLGGLADRLDETRRQPGGHGQAALDRDLEIHRLTARARMLRRYSLDLCLGRMVRADDPGHPVYIGRLGLIDGDGRQLLVDWRSPAAEPFFAATAADPRGLASRRRYRWTGGRITDFWDEAWTEEGRAHAALDDDSAFLASLGSSREPRMRDVLGTLQADQDAIIRAGSRGALVVDGGPGTGKTVVALHRAAYLLYADPRLGREQGTRRGGVLVVGPHQPYLAYVADVLPSLGEEGVQTCTLRDLVPGCGDLRHEQDAAVARLKADRRMVEAIEPAVGLYEEPPTTSLLVETPWGDLRLTAGDWAEAFGTPDPGTPHNEARAEVHDALVDILLDRYNGDDGERDRLRRHLRRHPALVDALGGAWPLLDPFDVVGDLWEVPAYLRHCAPWLGSEELQLLRRTDPRAWTMADLPLLDAARRRVGDPDASRRRARNEAVLASERAERSFVIDQLIEHDDSEMKLMSMLRGQDAQNDLDDPSGLVEVSPNLLAGPFAHIVVDEAQELTDAEWQTLLARCPSRSFTIVGDRAQARAGFPESWEARLRRVGFTEVRTASLSINYRTPEEVMAEAAPVIRQEIPDANVPTSIRRAGVAVRHGVRAGLAGVVADWVAANPSGTACVIGDPSYAATDRVQSLSPTLAKGLEFDLVVLVDPGSFGAGVAGAVDRYVAMTRTTRELVVLS